MQGIYLAGPISGLTYDESVEWRTEAARYLNAHGIPTFSPMRFKEFLGQEGPIASSGYTHPLATDRGIMTRDYNDVRRCDALLINFLGTKQISIGTVMEVAWAYMLQKPVVVIAEPDNRHFTHAMMNQAIGYRVDTLQEGLDIIRAVVGSDKT